MEKTPKTTPARRESTEESAKDRRDRLLGALPPSVIKDAWFSLTHLFLDDGAVIADMGSGDGMMTYAMAVLRPHYEFIGVDKDRRSVNKAKALYKLPNLSFEVGDAGGDIFEPESLDAVINANTLHSIYSHARYNEASVHQALDAQFKALRKEGMMFVRDYTRPPPEEFVLIEMPDTERSGDTIATFSEADFLVWYAEHARPKSGPGTGGFFLEELPERFPGTRLFRLPYQWAYEFILRKDNREKSERELPNEYTVFTQREFRKALQAQGARVQYSGPVWNNDAIDTHFEKTFKLYDDYGTLLGNPPTCYVAVAQKMAERKSLHIEERRPSHAEHESSLNVMALRDQKTGRIRDVVVRDTQSFDFIPYRLDSDGAIKVYLHEGVARSITNAVARSGENIHGKRWSGHMIESVCLNAELLQDKDLSTPETAALLARDTLGLKADRNAIIEEGPGYYPAPDYIQEYVRSYYLQVQPSKNALVPKAGGRMGSRFQAKGKIREMDAQQVLDAISLGMIPNSTLELQILALFERLSVTPESWQIKQIHMKAGEVTGNADLAKVLKQMRASETRFKDIKGSAGELRSVHSTFVEEGVSRGAMSGLTADDVDFIVHDNETINKAVVMPMTKNMKQEVHAGFHLDALPVPEKLSGKTNTISVPSFELPRHVTNYRLARKHIAEQFSVTPEMVIQMGEPYYCHVSITPQKIYPFVVAVPPDFLEDPDMLFMPMFQMALLNMRNSLNSSKHMMLTVARCYQYLSGDVEYNAMIEAKAIVAEQRAFDGPDWGFPVRYERPSFLKLDTQAPSAQPIVAKPTAPLLTPKSAAKPAAPTPFHGSQPEPSDVISHEEKSDMDAFLNLIAKPEPSVK